MLSHASLTMPRLTKPRARALCPSQNHLSPLLVPVLRRRQQEGIDLNDLLPKSFTDIYLDTLQFTFYEQVRLPYAPEPSPPASLKEPMSPGPWPLA